MNKVFILFFILANSLNCRNNSSNDNLILKNDSLDKYSGGYNGIVTQEDEFGMGTLEKQNITYYFSEEGGSLLLFDEYGEVNKCELFGNKVYIHDSFSKNGEKKYKGEFILNNGTWGLLVGDTETGKVFFEKTSSEEYAKQKIDENKNWGEFFEHFREIHDTRDINSITELISIPLYDMRKTDWNKPKVLNNSKEIKTLSNEIVNGKLVKGYDNSDKIDFFYYGNTEEKYFAECYRVDMYEMFLYFKILDGKKKLVMISNTYN